MRPPTNIRVCGVVGGGGRGRRESSRHCVFCLCYACMAHVPQTPTSRATAFSLSESAASGEAPATALAPGGSLAGLLAPLMSRAAGGASAATGDGGWASVRHPIRESRESATLALSTAPSSGPTPLGERVLDGNTPSVVGATSCSRSLHRGEPPDAPPSLCTCGGADALPPSRKRTPFAGRTDAESAGRHFTAPSSATASPARAPSRNLTTSAEGEVILRLAFFAHFSHPHD